MTSQKDPALPQPEVSMRSVLLMTLSENEAQAWSIEMAATWLQILRFPKLPDPSFFGHPLRNSDFATACC